MTGAGRAAVALLALTLVTGLAGGCAQDRPPLADRLERYTDVGDGCQQAVSAISYADDLLVAAGQERYQDFDDAVRSRVSAVAGTIALEARDFPSERALTQARVVARLAERTGRLGVGEQRRVRLLREYRREAMGLVLVCAREVDGL